eukprot:TRINITY_DN1004_c0_g1_i1.p1 TRINITY_DN1004_c0_g1~~TRINITY_DN1004_c0_g1_i1.p1  ORF type:complete len:290 (-),score=60.77 TRINITY_DN1004_c0_g1_i1:147-1016(-)
MNNDNLTAKNMLGSSLPPHLSGASPIAFFCGNLVWQNVIGAGQKILNEKRKDEQMDILQGPYDELHQVAFAPENQSRMVVENADYDDLNVRDENGNTPLMWAVFNENENMIQRLIEQGAAVNMQNYVGETALYLAAARGLDRICTFLLQSGSNSNFSNLDGITPLHIASANENYGVVKILVQHGAYVNSKDEEGDTPLHYAIREGKKRMVQLLVQLGADFGIKNDDDESSIDLASELGETEIFTFLAGQGRKPSNVEYPSEHQLYFGEDDMQASKHNDFKFFRTSVAFC